MPLVLESRCQQRILRSRCSGPGDFIRTPVFLHMYKRCSEFLEFAEFCQDLSDCPRRSSSPLSWLSSSCDGHEVAIASIRDWPRWSKSA